MAEDRTLLAFISEGERGRVRVYQLLGDQFVNSVLIRAPAGASSGMCLSDYSTPTGDGREKERGGGGGWEGGRECIGTCRLADKCCSLSRRGRRELYSFMRRNEEPDTRYPWWRNYMEELHERGTADRNSTDYRWGIASQRIRSSLARGRKSNRDSTCVITSPMFSLM